MITRKAYGGAYLAMSCKHLQSDYNVAWPTAELAVMGAEGAVNVIHRREINAVDDEHKEEVRLRLVSEYKNKFGDPYVAARNGWLDDVIEPEESRMRLCRALNIIKSKREWSPPKKHAIVSIIFSFLLLPKGPFQQVLNQFQHHPPACFVVPLCNLVEVIVHWI